MSHDHITSHSIHVTRRMDTSDMARLIDREFRCTRTHTHTHVRTHSRTHAHTHTHAHTQIRAHTHTHTHTEHSLRFLLVHMHSHTHALTHTCTHTHALTHTCTHTHAHSQKTLSGAALQSGGGSGGSANLVTSASLAASQDGAGEWVMSHESCHMRHVTYTLDPSSWCLDDRLGHVQ